MSDALITRLEQLGADEWAPEAPPPLLLPPVAASRRRRTLTLRPLPALAAALVLLALGASAGLVATRGPEEGRAVALAPLARGVDADGELRLARAGERATFSASGLAPSRRGEFYELWLLRPSGDLLALGSFRVGADGRARIEVPVPVDPSEYRFVDLSVEPDDGDPTHSSRSVLRGRVG